MEELMTQNIFEKAGDNITDSVREASRVTAAVADAIKDGVGAAERAARQGRDAVEDFVNAASADCGNVNIGRRVWAGNFDCFSEQAQVNMSGNIQAVRKLLSELREAYESLPRRAQLHVLYLLRESGSPSPTPLMI
jgi:hypothetical protein